MNNADWTPGNSLYSEDTHCSPSMANVLLQPPVKKTTFRNVYFGWLSLPLSSWYCLLWKCPSLSTWQVPQPPPCPHPTSWVTGPSLNSRPQTFRGLQCCVMLESTHPHPLSPPVPSPHFSLRRQKQSGKNFHRPPRDTHPPTCICATLKALLQVNSVPLSSHLLDRSYPLYLLKDVDSNKSSFSSLQVLLCPSLLDFSHQHINMPLNCPI